MADEPIPGQDKVKRDAKGRWLKGTSGNGGVGSPKRSNCVTMLLRELLEGDPPTVKHGWLRVNGGYLTGAQNVAWGFYEAMTEPDGPVLKEGLNRIEGRVPVNLQHTGKDGGDLKPEIIINVLGEKGKNLAERLMSGEGTE